MLDKPAEWIYMPLVSEDRTLLVQVFLDPATYLIMHAQVARRPDRWCTWGLPTEVFED